MRESRRPSTIPGLLLAGVLSLTPGCEPSVKAGRQSVSVLSGGERVELAIANDYDAEQPVTIRWTATGGTVDDFGYEDSVTATWWAPYCIPEGEPLPVVTATLTDAKGRSASAEFHFEESALFRCAVTGTASMSRGRVGHTATRLASGKVLVVGGVSGYTTPPPNSTGEAPAVLEASAELYDPSTGTWATTGALSQPRSGHEAHLLPSGKVLVVGGVWGWAPFNQERPDATTVELYEPSTGTWTVASELADLRYLERSVLLASGKLLMLGRIWSVLYDPEANTWSPVTTPRELAIQDALRLPSGKVLAVGKWYLPSDSQPRPLPAAWLYDPATGSWASTNPLNAKEAFVYGTLSPLASGEVLLIYRYPADGAAAELYEPEADTWAPTAAPPVELVPWRASTLLSTGQVLMPPHADSGWRLQHFDPATETWLVAGHMPVPVPEGATVTPLSSGQVLLVGGSSSRSAQSTVPPKSEVWLYSPRTP